MRRRILFNRQSGAEPPHSILTLGSIYILYYLYVSKGLFSMHFPTRLYRDLRDTSKSARLQFGGPSDVPHNHNPRSVREIRLRAPGMVRLFESFPPDPRNSGTCFSKNIRSSLHSNSARYANEPDQCADRKIWFQYWETHLTYPKSFLARLHYVHSNAVRHRLVRTPEAYPWCSAGWFERAAARSFYRTVMTFPCDQLAVPDEFECTPIERAVSAR
jgi:hypothetical protein